MDRDVETITRNVQRAWERFANSWIFFPLRCRLLLTHHAYGGQSVFSSGKGCFFPEIPNQNRRKLVASQDATNPGIMCRRGAKKGLLVCLFDRTVWK